MKWIWLSKENFPNYQKCRYTNFCKDEYETCVSKFVKKLEISKEISNAQIKISADTKYLLKINGQVVLRGPAEVGGDYGNKEPLGYWFFDREDITEYLKMGENTVEVFVRLGIAVQADYSMGHGGLSAELTLKYSDGTKEIIETDKTWKSGIAKEFHNPTKAQSGGMIYDSGEKETELFTSDEICDIWHAEEKPLDNLECINLKHKKLYTYYKDRITEKDGEIIISEGCPVTFTLDFGKVYSFYLNFKAADENRQEYSVYYEEILGFIVREELLLSSGKISYNGLALQTGRYIRITTRSIAAPTHLKITMDTMQYPVSDSGTFSCNDEFLNKLFNQGKHITKINRQSYHMDSPFHQEALGCTGDYMIESLINYYTFGETKLTRLDIIRTARLLVKKHGIMFHTSYSLLWTEMLWDYYMYSGDSKIFFETADALHILLKRFLTYIGKSGIIEDAPNYMFIDWVNVGDYNLHHPPKVLGQGAMTAFLYRALINGNRICVVMGDDVNAKLYKKCADKIKTAFNAHLFNEEKGLYIDGKNDKKYEPTAWLPYAEGEYYSQHTNSLAVLYGIADKNYLKPIMEKVINDTSLIQAQPYFYHFILNAVSKAGLFDKYGVELLYKWKGISDEADGGYKETFDMKSSDYSHAWGATPTYQMPSKILGITPKAPGFSEFDFNPNMCGLKWIKGTIPTPLGLIEVFSDGKESYARVVKI